MAGIAVGTWLSMAATAASAVYSGYKQKQMNDFNAKLADREAKYAGIKAESDVESRKREVARQMGQQGLGMATSGVSLMSGSFQDIELESMTEAEKDYQAIRFGGQLKSDAFNSQANLDRTAGSAALKGGFMKAGSSLLTDYGKYKPRSLNNG